MFVLSTTRGFPNGILRDKGHITTWIVVEDCGNGIPDIVTFGCQVNLICKVIICLNDGPRNCGYKFNEEQQRQKTLTIHQAVPAPVVRNI
jgi:hypothetical protein